ncbi:hypothetical protein TNCT_682331 [Trichonephila clavata]|uniref:Uncharacterized protein n=1 Tax=Trichonephila clavata TaxID=2740835 RepID=A0A8X6LV63_TRICU|nr:hypothetical protein TNCT_682331 [Trichonephila clavata]
MRNIWIHGIGLLASKFLCHPGQTSEVDISYRISAAPLPSKNKEALIFFKGPIFIAYVNRMLPESHEIEETLDKLALEWDIDSNRWSD